MLGKSDCAERWEWERAMLNVPENELFSAYLDGELTADEQAEVEHVVTTSPAARQLMDELRALSATLQSLPVVELNEDLSGRVLRAAERQLLSEPLVAGPTNVGFGRDPAARPRMLRRILRGRTLWWSGVAVAVAILLALGDSDNRSQRPGGNENDVAVATVNSADLDGPVPEVSAAEDPHPATVAAADLRPEERAVEPGTVEEPSPNEPAADRETMIADSADPTENTLVSDQATPEAVTTPDDSPKVAKPDDSVLIVKYDVSEKAAEGQVLSQILAKRKIARLNRTDTETGRVFVEVDLTPTQLRALVADLKSRREHFVEVFVPSTPGTAGPRIPSAAGTPQKVTGTLRVGSAAAGNVGATGNKGSLTGSASATGGNKPRVEVKVDGRATVPKAGQQTTKPISKPGADRPSREERKFRVRFELNVVAPLSGETDNEKSPAGSKEADAAPKTAK